MRGGDYLSVQTEGPVGGREEQAKEFRLLSKKKSYQSIIILLTSVSKKINTSHARDFKLSWNI